MKSYWAPLTSAVKEEKCVQVLGSTTVYVKKVV